MEEIRDLSNAQLLRLFEVATEGVDPGPNVVDAIANIKNAGEDKESVKKARKILSKYLVKKIYGEEVEIVEDEENYDEQKDDNAGGKRRRKRRTRKGRKSRRSRRSRKGRRSRKR